MIKEDTKQIYRYVGSKTIEIEERPHIEEGELYWKSLWENKYNTMERETG
jgi:hypothetical protein